MNQALGVALCGVGGVGDGVGEAVVHAVEPRRVGVPQPRNLRLYTIIYDCIPLLYNVLTTRQSSPVVLGYPSHATCNYIQLYKIVYRYYITFYTTRQSSPVVLGTQPRDLRLYTVIYRCNLCYATTRQCTQSSPSSRVTRPRRPRLYTFIDIYC